MRILFAGVLAWSLHIAIPACRAADELVRRLDGSTISPAQIDATVSRLMSAAEVTGVGIAILDHGALVYQKAYGVRDKERKLSLTPDTVMGAASLTKPAFAWLVMRLVDDGTIDLDRPVHEYLPKPLPDYPSYHDLAGDDRYRKITARMLLSHTAGFPNLRWLQPDRKLAIHFDPGARYAYSGEGLQLLQLVVETLTGTPLQDLMQHRVFEPLGMSRTRMVSDARLAGDLANGHDEYGRSIGPAQFQNAWAAGSMLTTLRDFTTFLQAVMNGKVLSQRSRQAMLSPQIEIFSRRQFPTLATETTDANRAIRLSYGLGWGLYQSPYGAAFFKEGHDDGFRNYAVAFDTPKNGIVILTNSANGEGIFQELLEALQRNTFTPIEWEGYTPYQKLAPRKPLPVHTEVTLTQQQLDRVTGRYAVQGVTLTVARKGGRLTLQENDGAPGDLYPEGELRFFSKTSDDVVTFELDEQGAVTRMTIHTGGRKIPVNRSR